MMRVDRSIITLLQALVLGRTLTQVHGDPQYNLIKGTKATSRKKGAVLDPLRRICLTEYPDDALLFFMFTWGAKVGMNEYTGRLELHKSNNNLVDNLKNAALFSRGTYLQDYEVINFKVDSLMKTADILLKAEEVCESAKIVRDSTRTSPRFRVRIHNEERWWCDVYDTTDFVFKDFGECDDLEKEYEAVALFSVTPIPMTMLKQDVDGCTIQMINQENEIFQIAMKKCAQAEQARSRESVRLLTFFSGHSLGAYHLSKGGVQLLNEEEVVANAEKVFRLFRMKREIVKGETYILVQYSKEGAWKCQDFKKQVNEINISYGGSEKGSCSRFALQTLPMA